MLNRNRKKYLVRASFHWFANSGNGSRVKYYGTHGADDAAPLIPFDTRPAARRFVDELDDEVYYLRNGESGRPTLRVVPVSCAPAFVRDQLRRKP